MYRFPNIYDYLLCDIMEDGEEVEVGQWQSQDVSDRPEMISRELRHKTVRLEVWDDVLQWQYEVKPNLPWAEDHFQERVSGEPLNPPPSEAWWPFRVRGNEDHKVGEIFHHTYPERIWCKTAGWTMGPYEYWTDELNKGIRYKYGDLNDVVNQLERNPLTRQAFLPIWFPEDTGAKAVPGQRVPCTLGYHFLSRKGAMDIVYYMRSCDLLRHFPDDVYMAGRLLQWVVGKLRERSVDVRPGELVMHISSLHVFRGDYERIKLMIAKMEGEEDDSIYGVAV